MAVLWYRRWSGNMAGNLLLLGEMTMAQPDPSMLGSGLAAKSGDAMKWRSAYQKAAEDAQTNGEEIEPFPEWVRKQTGGDGKGLLAQN